jgi:hypothetical protein
LELYTVGNKKRSELTRENKYTCTTGRHVYVCVCVCNILYRELAAVPYACVFVCLLEIKIISVNSARK